MSAVSWARNSAKALLIAGALVGGWEGYSHIGYDDGGGVPTACKGHTGKGVEIGQFYSDQQCNKWFQEDITRANRAVIALIHVDIDPKTEAAFTSWVYNVGIQAAAGSTLVRLANQGAIVDACNQLSRWVYDNGQRVQGLVNRRLAERRFCLDGAGKIGED